MDVADELCELLFQWINQQKRCADHLKSLAKELEEMRELMTKGQLVGNSATVLGSAALIGSGIATFLTGGVAAPLLVTAASITAGVGAATSLTFSTVEAWKSSETMKNADETIDKIKRIQDNIQRLRKQMEKECKSKYLEKLSSDEEQHVITATILSALAKRNGRNLSINSLTRLLLNDGMHIDPTGLNVNILQICNMGLLLGVLGLSVAVLEKKALAKGAEYSAKLVAANVTKAAIKGTGQVFFQRYNTHKSH